MHETKLAEGLSERVTALQSELSGKTWSELSKDEFIYRISSCLKEMDAIHGILLAFEKSPVKKLEIDENAMKSLGEDSSAIIKTIKATLELEKHQKTGDFSSINPFMPVTNRESQWHLQEKLLSFALKARYTIEKLNISFAKSFLPPIKKSEESRHLLGLLEDREQEIVSLKEELQGIKKKSFLGYLKETTSADIEAQLKRMAIDFERKKSDFERMKGGFEKKVSMLEGSFKELSQQLGAMEDNFLEYHDKNDKLVLMLKRERDLAKKTLLEAETELSELRNRYSMEILTLDQQKAMLEENIRKELSVKVKRAMEEAKRNHEAVEHFRELLRRKEEELGKIRHSKIRE